MLWKNWSVWISSACLALALPLTAQAQARFEIRLAGEKDKEIEIAAAELPSYWIGVALKNADPALLAHLKLDHGVLVAEVIADSPAAKAGMKPLDIITHAGETEIKSGEDLLKAVAVAKETEIVLTVYREAKKESVKITPAKRPEDQVAPHPHPPQAVEGQPREAVEQALRLWKAHAGPLELDLLGPGVVVRAEPAPLPDDMKIIVEREGKNPAKITVKQGDNSWGATEEEIDTLPEVARPHARMMLGLPANRVFAFREKLPKIAVPVTPPQIKSREELRIEFDDPLKRIEEDLKQLRKEVEEIRKQSADK